MSHEQHQRIAAEGGPVSLGIITVSDTRTKETDLNGQFLIRELLAAGHHLTLYQLIKDEPDQVQSALEQAAAAGVQVLLFNGGTGISARDTTYDALAARLEKTLPGFGELFRMLSWEQVGAAAMLSRAVAGTYHGMVVFSTPGSHKAVVLAWEKLIAPELAHLAWELAR
ncbi:MogA/MoaB family molybdenum cofactor biosynthesis protein [Armatimonas rosea]|uniref:Molybdenum cofactor biosynthesis protein B n=1 Tax=Armatimonas rosea TaxID=685828 RepID=A0A7W9W3U3_ARMRO|nr:molybdenum cofactor biosynthesis protein B [Armatimonas rosea]MBB6048739.1 molybdenum cofactor biosynthesis protein B [Armatimonas rosea]